MTREQFQDAVWELNGSAAVANAWELYKQSQHALWMAREKDAKHLVVAFENYDYLDLGRLTIEQKSDKTWMTCKLHTPAEWVKIWKNVQAKCRKKAKEYK